MICFLSSWPANVLLVNRGIKVRSDARRDRKTRGDRFSFRDCDNAARSRFRQCQSFAVTRCPAVHGRGLERGVFLLETGEAILRRA